MPVVATPVAVRPPGAVSREGRIVKKLDIGSVVKRDNDDVVRTDPAVPVQEVHVQSSVSRVGRYGLDRLCGLTGTVFGPGFPGP